MSGGRGGYFRGGGHVQGERWVYPGGRVGMSRGRRVGMSRGGGYVWGGEYVQGEGGGYPRSHCILAPSGHTHAHTHPIGTDT